MSPPIYEYQCQKCGEISVEFHKMSEDYSGNLCTLCMDGAIKKVISATPGRLAGPVWHEGMKPSEFVKKNTDHRG